MRSMAARVGGRTGRPAASIHGSVSSRIGRSSSADASFPSEARRSGSSSVSRSRRPYSPSTEAVARMRRVSRRTRSACRARGRPISIAEPSSVEVKTRPSLPASRVPLPKVRPATTSSGSRSSHDHGDSPAANAARSAALSASMAERTTSAANSGRTNSRASARTSVVVSATQRAPPGDISAIQQGLDPRGADEVVQRESADVVGGPQDRQCP